MVAAADASLIWVCCRVMHRSYTQRSYAAFGMPSAFVALLDTLSEIS